MEFDFTQFYKDLYKQIFIQNWKIFLLIAVLFIIKNVLSSKKKPRSKVTLKGKYKRAKFLTEHEKTSASIIKRFADRYNYIMSCKVRMVDVVEPINEDKSLFGKISQKHFDFVLSDNTGHVVLIIEINDSSHNSKSAKERDNVKNVILEDVGIPLLRTYNITEYQISDKLNLITSPSRF